MPRLRRDELLDLVVDRQVGERAGDARLHDGVVEVDRDEHLMSISMPPASAISCLFSSFAESLRSAPATRACTLALP